MLKAPIPKNESERLAALKEFHVLDTLQDEQLDEITKAASLLCDCSISLISLIDTDRQWFKSKHGLDADETPRDISYCGHAIMGDDLFIVEDAELDVRFCDNPLFTGAPHVRFYTGAPLVTTSGHRIGTLCVIDSESKKLDEKQKILLQVFSKMIVTIFESKKLLSTQEESKNELYNILSSSPSCSKIINSKGELLDMNRQGLKLIEANDFESVKLANVYDIVDEKHREEFKEFNEKICSGENGTFIFEIIGLKGTKRWMETYAAPYNLQSGEVAHIAITNDISKKINDEKDYAKQKAIAFQNTKLASIGELAAGVGHEINNPLTIAMGNISKLKKNSKFDDEVKSQIDLIDNATRRIQKITDGLREFSHFDKQKSALDLVDVLLDSLNFVKDIYKTYGVRVSFDDKSTKKLVVSCNRTEIQQVLMNLISNAKDASEGKKTREILITLENVGNTAVVRVRDNGDGIPKSIQDKVFDSFFTSKEVGRGTGIGLSLVNKIITEHDGNVSFESEIEKGTTFIIELPLEINETVAKAKDDENFVEIFNKDLKVLIVDDEEGIREILEYMFLDFGIAVDSCENGNIAFQKIQENIYDLVLSDIQMPELTGPDLLQLIRQDESLAQPKMIFITGGINVQNTDKYQEVFKLCNGFVDKPFDEKDLIKSINIAFKEK